jgi:hypothetical protein
MKNEKIEKLKNKYLPNASFEHEICDLACGSHCQEYLGCTKWRKYKGSKERVVNFIIVSRENPDDDTLAHEFTHAFLTYHYDFSEHHGKGEISEKKNTRFWSLKEWFLQFLQEIRE